MTVRQPGPLLNDYLRGMATSVQRWEESEAVYTAVVDAHVERWPESRILAEQKAATHPDLMQARGDGAFYRDRAQTYALGAIALMLHEQWYEQKGADR